MVAYMEGIVHCTRPGWASRLVPWVGASAGSLAVPWWVRVRSLAVGAYFCHDALLRDASDHGSAAVYSQVRVPRSQPASPTSTRSVLASDPPTQANPSFWLSGSLGYARLGCAMHARKSSVGNHLVYYADQVPTVQ
ncbi:hypothetical protein B0H12DRAFT_1121366 [Mycena haematopus]|nr:hypothetical protein B0H12DRAFT_1121366 [Mycena haematopus]